MDLNKPQSYAKDRFLKLSLKKNKPRKNNMIVDCNYDMADMIFDSLKSDLLDTVESSVKMQSPIVIDDSSEIIFDDLPIIDDGCQNPSQKGNVSINISSEDNFKSPQKTTNPSTEGWSPAQNIVCATPKHKTTPSTNADIFNESVEECSIKKIQKSQQQLLDDLYGEVWKSIPKLFKPATTDKNYDAITKKLDFDYDSDKENVREDIKKLKQNILTDSEVKRKVTEQSDTDKKAKKKLYSEKVPSTPDVKRQKNTNRNGISTKKLKQMTVTDLVQIMNKDPDFIEKQVIKEVDMIEKTVQKEVDMIIKKVQKVMVTPKNNAAEIRRLSFVGSLADNVPSWRCNFEAMQYIDDYKKLREKLTYRLYTEFNEGVFDRQLDADLPILWDTKLRSTAGTTTNRLIKTSSGARIRTSTIKLSTKVIDRPQRLRDTLIHELCHAATWLIDAELRAGHGPLWKKWATRALAVFPELGEISRCHDMEIHYKYCFKCTQCGYSIKRHSKSIDVTKKCCGYCRGTFELIVNKKNKDGLIVSTPARKGGPNDFALYVKENYGTLKDGSKTHAQVMKILGEQFKNRTNLNKVS